MWWHLHVTYMTHVTYDSLSNLKFNYYLINTELHCSSRVAKTFHNFPEVLILINKPPWKWFPHFFILKKGWMRSQESRLSLYFCCFSPPAFGKGQKSWITEMYHLPKPFIIRQPIISKITECYEINSQNHDYPDETDRWWPWWPWT